jgi:hypothetical protein
MLYPMTPTDVLVFHPKFTLCCGAVADPVSDSTEGEFAALPANVTFADADPVLCGANVTANATLLPAAIVTGSEIPLTEN